MTSQSKQLLDIRRKVEKNAERVAGLAGWTDQTMRFAKETILDWIPGGKMPELETPSGFNPMIASALDMIPREMQKFACSFHLPLGQLVQLPTDKRIHLFRNARQGLAKRINKDLPFLPIDWWLAVNHFCKMDEGEVVGEEEFLEQIESFQKATEDHEVLFSCALKQRSRMRPACRVDGIPFSVKYSGIQGAFMFDHDCCVWFSEKDERFYIVTLRPSLGLEDFPFAGKTDKSGFMLSGIELSRPNWAITDSFEELGKALGAVRSFMGIE
ncbi:hypothetical protein KKC32_02255 [Patescibacteria group bacterium]|nr:hypothetical protein [Patescibacteria group bacterium]